MKIKITEKVENEVEKEISLPYYSKDDEGHNYAIINEDNMIEVFRDMIISVTGSYSFHRALREVAYPISQNEFKLSYTKALNNLDKIIANEN